MSESFLPVVREILSPIPPLICDECEEPCFASDWSTVAEEFICQHCADRSVDDALAQRKLEQQP